MKRFKLWEIALAFGVLCALAFGTWANAAQDGLSDKLVRLHVVANSNSEYDQGLKLRVRDRVLEAAHPLLENSSGSKNAAETLRANLPYLENAARQELNASGCDMQVRAELVRTDFPTREYEGFELPAGTYQALRITIGEGKGRNWWCVVFPPLCDAGADISESARAAGLTDGEVKLITESEGVKLKFKFLEIWQKLKKLL